MLSEHTVVEAARTAGITAPVHFLPVTGSTNADLLRLAEEGAPEWTLVVANQQEAGRGRLGRTWFSSPGGSLLASVLLRPSLPPPRAPLLSLLAAAACAEACGSACRLEVRCKWPNDIVVGDRKLGGILPEAGVKSGRLDYVVIGTGVNVAQHQDDFPPELRTTATSIALEGGRVEMGELLLEFLLTLKRRYQRSGENLGPEVLPVYRRLCATLGREVVARTTGGGEIRGRAVAVGESGELVVETPEGSRSIEFGEIEHLG